MRKIGRTSLFFTQKSDSRYFHQRTGTTFDGFTIIFLVEQKTKYMTKNSDISGRKFKNIESPKMVSKRLKGHYLRGY